MIDFQSLRASLASVSIIPPRERTKGLNGRSDAPMQGFDDLPIGSTTPPDGGAGDSSGMFADGFNFDEVGRDAL
jgi:hypothetical protein